MFCPKCNSEIEDNTLECSSCGIVIAKYRPAEPFSPGAGAPESEAKRNSVNIPYFKIGIAIAVVILLWMVLKPKHAPEMTVVSFESKETITLSCDLAEKCVIVYLAPW